MVKMQKSSFLLSKPSIIASESVSLGTNLSSLCFPFCEIRFEPDSPKVVAIKVEIVRIVIFFHWFVPP